MTKLRKLFPILGLTLVALIALGGTMQIKAASKDAKVIADGVYIGSIDVGGMTKKEAKSAIDDYVTSLNKTTFTLNGANGTVDVTAEQMGITTDTDTTIEEAMAVGQSGSLINRYKDTKDLESGDITIDMILEVDKQKTAQYLYDNKAILNKEAVNMGLTRENGSFQIVEGEEGSEIDYVESVYGINNYLASEWDGENNVIDLVCTEVDPKGSEEELAKVKDVLGKFSTDFHTSAAGRAQNVKNGCARINGTVLYPGDEFSTYETVSPFTAENGYELAGSYSNGTTVESFGGGICQVSTTLYNAVLAAELEVTARYNHSMLVTYVEPSDDAAIAGTYKDFRFKNNSDSPIYIEGYCSGGIITFNIYGEETRATNRTVEYVSETLETTDPEIQFQLTADQPVGYYSKIQSSHTGIKAKLWKVVKVDGVEQSREQVNSSTYQSSPKIVAVGTGGASEEQLAQINAAIATATESKDESSVQSTVASIAATIASPPADTSTQTPAADTTTPAADSNTQTNPSGDANNTTSGSGSQSTTDNNATGGTNPDTTGTTLQQ